MYVPKSLNQLEQTVKVLKSITQQGDVIQAFAEGRSASAVKFLVNSQGHKITLQRSRRVEMFETHNLKLYVTKITFTVAHKK